MGSACRSAIPEAIGRFERAAAAAELLGDPAARASYDATLARPAVGNQAARSAPATPDLTPIEAKIKASVEAGTLDDAVAAWAGAGADLKLLLFLIELCTKAGPNRSGQVPKDLRGLLGHLHSAEPGGGGGGKWSTSNQAAGGVQLFVERKTKAYNDLLRLVDIAGTREQIFEVYLYNRQFRT